MRKELGFTFGLARKCTVLAECGPVACPYSHKKHAIADRLRGGGPVVLVRKAKI